MLRRQKRYHERWIGQASVCGNRSRIYYYDIMTEENKLPHPYQKFLQGLLLEKFRFRNVALALSRYEHLPWFSVGKLFRRIFWKASFCIQVTRDLALALSYFG